jgi:hypothetical protein
MLTDRSLMSLARGDWLADGPLELLQAGVDLTVIALWLDYESPRHYPRLH